MGFLSDTASRGLAFQRKAMGGDRLDELLRQKQSDEAKRLKEQEKALAPPPPAPDLTDIAVRTAGLAERQKQLAGRGRRSSFLSSSGDLSAPVIGYKTLMGG